GVGTADAQAGDGRRGGGGEQPQGPQRQAAGGPPAVEVKRKRLATKNAKRHKKETILLYCGFWWFSWPFSERGERGARMATRRSHYGWMLLGGLLCLFGLALVCKLRDGNRALAQSEPVKATAAEQPEPPGPDEPPRVLPPITAAAAPPRDLVPAA